MKPIKLKKLSIKKLDNILSKLAAIGIVNCRDFIKVLNKEHKPLDYVDINLIAPKPTLQIAIKNKYLGKFVTIPVVLVKDDKDSYKEFLEYWNMFREELKIKPRNKNPKPIKSMLKLDMSDLDKFIEFINLDLTNRALAFLVNELPKDVNNYGVCIGGCVDGTFNIEVMLPNTNNNYLEFKLDPSNLEQFIHNWNNTRELHFVHNMVL